MMGTNPNTWPQGVIWGHMGGVSKEMGHCRGIVTGICTCSTCNVRGLPSKMLSRGCISAAWMRVRARQGVQRSNLTWVCMRVEVVDAMEVVVPR